MHNVRQLVYLLRCPNFPRLKYLQHAIESSSRIRLASSAVAPRKKIQSEAPIYIKRDEDNKSAKKAAVRALEDLLEIKTFNAVNIWSNHKSFKTASSALLRKNHAVFIQNNISKETMSKYPQILAVVDVEPKLEKLKELPYDINKVTVLLTLSLGDLTRLVDSEQKDEKKIQNLSKSLQLDIEEVCRIISSKPFLGSLNTLKLKSTVKLLNDYGITLNDIHNDLWILKYSDKAIKGRLDEAKRHKIQDLRTWMVRADSEIFLKYIQRRSDKISILGNSSLSEYLSERLKCMPETAEYLISKQPTLLNKNLKSLDDLISFLLDLGFTSNQICHVPKILVHSKKLINKRLQQLQEMGLKHDSLYVFTKSKNQFALYCQSFVDKNKSGIGVPLSIDTKQDSVQSRGDDSPQGHT